MINMKMLCMCYLVQFNNLNYLIVTVLNWQIKLFWRCTIYGILDINMKMVYRYYLVQHSYLTDIITTVLHF